jgi:hypothetical protein
MQGHKSSCRICDGSASVYANRLVAPHFYTTSAASVLRGRHETGGGDNLTSSHIVRIDFVKLTDPSYLAAV